MPRQEALRVTWLVNEPCMMPSTDCSSRVIDEEGMLGIDVECVWTDVLSALLEKKEKELVMLINASALKVAWK